MGKVVVTSAKGWREWTLIPRLYTVLGAPLDQGNDSAVLAVAGQTVVSVDQHVEGIDFDRSFMLLEDVGYRALAAALSDLAATGADALAYLLVLALPSEMAEEEILALAQGLAEAAQDADVVFAGGDLGSSPALALTLTVLGRLPLGQEPLRRSGAEVGDWLIVTGRPGLAALGLASLRRGWGIGEAEARFLRPVPRLSAGRALRRLGAHAAIDVTDGLAHEIWSLARASRRGAVVDLATLPALPTLPEGVDPIELALSGGDDYELLATIPPERLPAIAAELADLPLTVIGRIVAEAEGVMAVLPDGRRQPLPERGYEHGHTP